jgi:chromosome partitioning protein
MDPVDPKRRGIRLFGGRRRHEHAAEDQMNESTTTLPEPVVSGGGPDREEGPGSEAPGGTEEPSVSESPPVSTEAPSAADAADATESGNEITVASDPEPIVEISTDEQTGRDAVAAAATAAADEAEIGIGTADPVEEAPGDAVTEVTGSTTTEEDEGSDEDVEPYELPRILAIANQKGGVGKTTTSVNLGAALAEMGYRVLVVDLDPQGNATTGLGVNARELDGSIYDVIMNDAAIEDCVEPTSLKNLFVAPATIDLAGAEIELVPAFSRELKLRRALHEIRDDYDYMLIDCPPSLGLLTVNGLAAADDVVVPIQCEYYALEGLSQLIRNVSLVQKNLNPSLSVRGIVLTMYDARTKLADQVEQEVRNHFGRTVYQTVVPRTVRLSEAPSFGQPIILFDPTSRGAVAYRELAKEVSSGATRRTG